MRLAEENRDGASAFGGEVYRKFGTPCSSTGSECDCDGPSRLVDIRPHYEAFHWSRAPAVGAGTPQPPREVVPVHQAQHAQ